MNKLALLCALVLLTCCTQTPRPTEALARVNHEFDGRYIGLFFASYGAAGGSMHLDDGGRLYHWLSLDPQGGGGSTDLFTRPGGTYGVSPDATNGEIVTGYCKVNIVTDNQDKIKAITLVGDSIGKFSGSRCSEIFGQSPN